MPGRQSLKVPTNIEESGEIVDEDGAVQGYSEESVTEHERYQPRIDPGEDVRDDSTREPRGRERPPGSGGPGGIRIDVEDHGYRAPG